MSVYEEDDFINSDLIDVEVDLDPAERGGSLLLPCFVVFADLDVPGQVEDFDPKWQVTFRLPKNEPAFLLSGEKPELRHTEGGDPVTLGSLLFSVCDLIGQKTWKNDAVEKLDAIWSCIENGIAPQNSNISIQDGDLHKPEYNAGHWLVKASRRPDEGPPSVVDAKGQLIPVYGQEGSFFTGDLSNIPRIHDFCTILIRVWAQKKRDRLNFSIEGIRLVEKGAGAKAINAARAKEITHRLTATALPALPAGYTGGVVEEEQVALPAKASKKKAAAKRGAAKKATSKKSAAKKGTSKRKGSVFRGRGK